LGQWSLLNIVDGTFTGNAWDHGKKVSSEWIMNRWVLRADEQEV